MRDQIASDILTFCQRRAPDKSICPSEVARSVAVSEENWRALMPTVRALARDLARQGQVVVLHGGKSVDEVASKGSIRLALA